MKLTGLPLAAPAHPDVQKARSSLRIVLRHQRSRSDLCRAGRGPAPLLPARRRSSRACRSTSCCAAMSSASPWRTNPNDASPTMLPASAIRPVGFAPEEALYPWSARSFSGFRLLTEYFALPEKFLFVDLCGLDARTLIQSGTGSRSSCISISRCLIWNAGCSRTAWPWAARPMVNLFAQQCEPVLLTYRETEYHVAPDNRRPKALEIWSIERVRELRGDGSARPWRPFYRHPAEVPAEQEPSGFFNVIRRPSSGAMTGTDVFLAPFDPGLSIDRPADTVLSVDALCTNRDLPGELPFGGGQPQLHLTEGVSAVRGVTCLTAPTPSLRAPLREHRNWRLISHLSLGHLSIVGGAGRGRQPARDD